MKIVCKLYPSVIPFLLLFAYFIYSPGFSAGFIFDDEPNLSKFNEIRVGFEGFWQFLTQVERPLAFLAFMLNDNFWPSSPESFIQTNILLHLLCACLLLVVFILIGKNLNWSKNKRELIAVYASFIWLIHPLFVSTTLYVVQRMTILSAIFVLLSLISYLHGRLQLATGSSKGWYWLIFATPVFGFVGLLSKENAALIPFYLLVFELTLFANEELISKYYLLWKKSFIYFPILIMAISVFIYWDSLNIAYEIRDFNLIERLLTQANILIYYLFLLLIPKISTFGVHYENYPITTSLIEPWTTLPAVACIVGIILFSIYCRKKFSVIAFAILFFFAGHLMESTFIGLELYFEHRNYLPSMMFFFALTYGLFQFYEKYRRPVILAATAIIILLSTTTYARSELWGNTLLLLSVWTKNNPGSARNYVEGHIQAHRSYRQDLAQDFLERGIENIPNNLQLHIGRISYGCALGVIERSDIDRIKVMMATTHSQRYFFDTFSRLIKISSSSQCEVVTHKDVRDLLNEGLKNPKLMNYNDSDKMNPIQIHEIMHLIGLLELESGNYIKAKDAFLESFLSYNSLTSALQQVALLGSHGHYILAYEYLMKLEELIYGKGNIEQRNDSNITGDHYNNKMLGWNDFAYMKSVLLKKLNSKPSESGISNQN